MSELAKYIFVFMLGFFIAKWLYEQEESALANGDQLIDVSVVQPKHDEALDADTEVESTKAQKLHNKARNYLQVQGQPESSSKEKMNKLLSDEVTTADETLNEKNNDKVNPRRAAFLHMRSKTCGNIIDTDSEELIATRKVVSGGSLFFNPYFCLNSVEQSLLRQFPIEVSRNKYFNEIEGLQLRYLEKFNEIHSETERANFLVQFLKRASVEFAVAPRVVESDSSEITVWFYGLKKRESSSYPISYVQTKPFKFILAPEYEIQPYIFEDIVGTMNWRDALGLGEPVTVSKWNKALNYIFQG